MAKKIVVVHKHQRSASPFWRGVAWCFGAVLALGLIVALAIIIVPAVIGVGTGYYATRTSPGNRIRGMFIGGSVGLVIGMVAFVAISNSGDEDPVATAATVPSTTTAPVTMTMTEAPATITEAPVSTTTAAAGVSWTMPDLVGQNLQGAQDAIQALTDFEIAFTTSHDAAGRGRMQVLDSGWIVCDQNAAPGTDITPDTQIDFGVVKDFETCP